jgi:stalled ribosome alternative rescue factor ArfA
MYLLRRGLCLWELVMASKSPNMIHKLDKATRERHFPESNGGKGSHARKSTTESRETFKSNYDNIDWSDKTCTKSNN